MPSQLRFSPDVDIIVDVVARSRPEDRPHLVVIDGASGTGKTSLAELLVQTWPQGRHVQVVHMDDLYPGWDGLEAAIVTLDSLVLAEWQAGQSCQVPRFDWMAATFVDGIQLVAGADLIIEGCGSLGSTRSAAGQARLWLTADEDLRRDRALSRPGEDFAAHWQAWDRQFSKYVERVRPVDIASLSVVANR